MEGLFVLLGAGAAASAAASLVVELWKSRREMSQSRNSHRGRITVTVVNSHGEEIQVSVPTDDEVDFEQAILAALAKRNEGRVEGTAAAS